MGQCLSLGMLVSSSGKRHTQSLSCGRLKEFRVICEPVHCSQRVLASGSPDTHMHTHPSKEVGSELHGGLCPATHSQLSLSQASSLPMSIIIVGVGPAMFEGEWGRSEACGAGWA